MKRNVMAVVVAGGSGRRFGGELPKQYCLLEGRPVVMHTIERMRRALQPYGCADNVVLAIHPDCKELWDDLCREYRFESPRVVFGGETRWHTVSNSLQTVPDGFDGIVLVHDAARPLVSPEVTDRLVEAVMTGAQGAVPVVAVTDSLRRVAEDADDTFGSSSVDRSRFRAVQTPQAFDCKLLRIAYSRPYRDVMTDDASVMELAGFDRIATVEGDARTLKITHPADIATAAFYLTSINN